MLKLNVNDDLKDIIWEFIKNSEISFEEFKCLLCDMKFKGEKDPGCCEEDCCGRYSNNIYTIDLLREHNKIHNTQKE